MRIKCIGSKEAAMNDNSVWPVVTAVMVVLAVAVCLAMAGDIRFAVICSMTVSMSPETAAA